MAVEGSSAAVPSSLTGLKQKPLIGWLGESANEDLIAHRAGTQHDSEPWMGKQTRVVNLTGHGERETGGEKNGQRDRKRGGGKER